jgi:hypothetical protein
MKCQTRGIAHKEAVKDSPVALCDGAGLDGWTWRGRLHRLYTEAFGFDAAFLWRQVQSHISGFGFENEAIMDFDTWHQWLLLRPLIVFVLACPLLILAVLVGWYKQRRDARRSRGAEAGRMPAGANGALGRGYEVAASARQTPHEWRVGPRKTPPGERLRPGASPELGRHY